MITVLRFSIEGVKPNYYGWLQRGEGGLKKLKKWLHNTLTAPKGIILVRVTTMGEGFGLGGLRLQAY